MTHSIQEVAEPRQERQTLTSSSHTPAPSKKSGMQKGAENLNIHFYPSVPSCMMNRTIKLMIIAHSPVCGEAPTLSNYEIKTLPPPSPFQKTFLFLLRGRRKGGGESFFVQTDGRGARLVTTMTSRELLKRCSRKEFINLGWSLVCMTWVGACAQKCAPCVL